MSETPNFSNDFEQIDPLTHSEKKKGSGKAAAIAVLAVALAGSAGFNGYQFWKNKKNQSNSVSGDQAEAAKLTSRIQGLTDTAQMFINTQASLNEATKNLADAEERANKAAAGGTRPMGPPIPMTDAERAEFQQRENSIRQKNRELEALVADLKRQVASKPIQTALSGKPLSAGEKAEFEKKVQELMAKLDEVNAKLAEVTAERDKYSEDLAKSRMENEDVLNSSKKLKVGGLFVQGIFNKGTSQLPTYKAKEVEKFKIQYEVIENSMVKSPEDHEVIIRLLGPEGDVLTWNADKLSDKSKLATSKQTVMFDGEQRTMKSFFPATGSMKGKFKKGLYKCELIVDGELKSKTQFDLN